MRSVFGVLTLLMVVAVVGLLAKKQLSAVSAIKPPMPVASGVLPQSPPTGNIQQQSQQVQQQFKAATEAALQQPRAVPDEK